MMPNPFDSWVLARLIADQPLNGELAGVSEAFRPLAERLAATSPDGRPAILDAFSLALPDPGAMIKALSSIKPDGPPPAPEAKRLTAHLGDLVTSQGASRFIWPFHLVRAHFNLFSSDPKIGKTHVALDLARRMYTAEAWPDGQPATFPAGSTTIWVCGDRHQDELRERAAAFGLPPEAILLNASPDEPYAGWDLDDPDNVDALRRRVEAERPAMIIIDTLWRATRRKMHATADVNELMDPLMAIAQECDTTILGLMHLSKDNETIGRRLEGLARAIIKLFKPDPGQPDRRKLIVTGNFREPPPLGVTIRDGGCDFDSTPPEEPAKSPAGRPPGKRDEARKFIVDALIKQNDRKATELCSEWVSSGEAEGTFWNARDAMVAAGELTCDGKPKIMHLIPAQQPPPP